MRRSTPSVEHMLGGNSTSLIAPRYWAKMTQSPVVQSSHHCTNSQYIVSSSVINLYVIFFWMLIKLFVFFYYLHNNEKSTNLTSMKYYSGHSSLGISCESKICLWMQVGTQVAVNMSGSSYQEQTWWVIHVHLDTTRHRDMIPGILELFYFIFKILNDFSLI